MNATTPPSTQLVAYEPPTPRVGLGDGPPSVPAASSITINTSGVSWPAMLLIAAGALAAGGALVYFFGPELGLTLSGAREEEEEEES